MNTESFTVFGAGTWGATLACLLAGKGAAVKVWEFAPEVVEQINATRSPAKLPHLKMPDDMLVTNDIVEAIDGSDHWVVVTPSHGVRALGKRLADAFATSRPETIVVCAKGIESETGLTMTQVMDAGLGGGASQWLVALSGPSHAEEVSRGMPTTVVAAAETKGVAERAQGLFNTPRFRVYTGGDVLGVELGAALKNVIAIAAGACDGMGFGDNTRAALVTRGLAEMTRLGVQMGARRETFSGLAGMGDLIVTAGSRHSRNHNFGELLGQGVSADAARQSIGMEVEGVYAARSAHELAARHDVSMPIAAEVYAILYEAKSTSDAMRSLLARDPKPEIWG